MPSYERRPQKIEALLAEICRKESQCEIAKVLDGGMTIQLGGVLTLECFKKERRPVERRGDQRLKRSNRGGAHFSGLGRHSRCRGKRLPRKRAGEVAAGEQDRQGATSDFLTKKSL